MSEIKPVEVLGTPPELTPSEIQTLYNILRSEGDKLAASGKKTSRQVYTRTPSTDTQEQWNSDEMIKNV